MSAGSVSPSADRSVLRIAAQVRRPFPRWPGPRGLHAADPPVRISGRSSSSPRSTPARRSRPGCGCTSLAMRCPDRSRPALARPRDAVRLPAGRPCRLRAHRDPELDGPFAAERMAARGPVSPVAGGPHRLCRRPRTRSPPWRSTSRSRRARLCGLARGRGRAQLEERARGGHDHAVRAGQCTGPRSQSRLRFT